FGQFRQADVDRDNHLTAEEAAASDFPYLKALLALADRDDDGRLHDKELNLWTEVQQDLLATHALASLLDHEGLFATLDLDRDGCLSLPEVRSGSQSLLVSSDTAVSRRTVQIWFSRGRPVGGLTRPSRPAALAPDWFQNMDANGDGVVSK